MLGGAKVVVVVPAFDEEERIAGVLAAMPPLVDAIFVVDDASRDRTAAVVRASIDPRVSLFVHAENRGVGAAIATGYREALARGGKPHDAFVVMAGDGQMDPEDLPALVRPIARGEADYVKGNRFAHPDVARTMPRARRLGGEVFSRLTSIAIGRPVHDSQCGYTAHRARRVRAARPRRALAEVRLSERSPRAPRGTRHANHRGPGAAGVRGGAERAAGVAPGEDRAARCAGVGAANHRRRARSSPRGARSRTDMNRFIAARSGVQDGHEPLHRREERGPGRT